MDKELDTAWYNAFADASKAFFDYVNKNLDSLCATGSEDASGAEAFFNSIAGGAPAPTAAPAKVEAKPEPVAEKVEAKVEAKVEVVEAKPVEQVQAAAPTGIAGEYVAVTAPLIADMIKSGLELKNGPVVAMCGDFVNALKGQVAVLATMSHFEKPSSLIKIFRDHPLE